MYANKKTVDEKRSSRGRELAHELERKSPELPGLDWAGFGLDWCSPVGLAARLECHVPGVSRAWCRVARRRGGWPNEERERRMKERRKREKKRRKKRGREREERRKRERKKREVSGCSSFETQFYSVFDFSEEISFSIVFRQNFDFKLNHLENKFPKSRIFELNSGLRINT